MENSLELLKNAVRASDDLEKNYQKLNTLASLYKNEDETKTELDLKFVEKDIFYSMKRAKEIIDNLITRLIIN